MSSKYAQLCAVVAEHSTAPHLLSFDEWGPSRCLKVEDETCVCGQKHICIAYTIQNTVNGETLYPIGSKCIERFAGVGEGQIDKDRLAHLRAQMRLLGSQAPCSYPGCDVMANGGFCDAHAGLCMAQAHAPCWFRKHRGVAWWRVVTADLPYAKFAATITNFDHPEYGDRNRQRVGYLLAQIAACEAAVESPPKTTPVAVPLPLCGVCQSV